MSFQRKPKRRGRGGSSHRVHRRHRKKPHKETADPDRAWHKKRLKSENLHCGDANIIKALPHYDLHSLRLHGERLPVGVGGEMAAGRLEESERKAARQRGGLETILYADTDPHRSICRV